MITLGVCFEEQVFDELPCDGSDVLLNFVMIA
jgi:5-formyltetrahydrofolate cyclo-ligase